MVVLEEVEARGHPNIRATHRTTLEITKDKELTPRGDCIIGVRANKSVADLSLEFKEALRNPRSILIAELIVGDLRDLVLAQGSSLLRHENRQKMILRKSEYIDDATLAVRANKAAHDLRRDLVDLLRDPEAVLLIRFIVVSIDELKQVNTGPGGVF